MTWTVCFQALWKAVSCKPDNMLIVLGAGSPAASLYNEAPSRDAYIKASAGISEFLKTVHTAHRCRIMFAEAHVCQNNSSNYTDNRPDRPGA